MPGYGFATLLEQPPYGEELIMLHHFSQVASLVLPNEALALFRMALWLQPESRLLEIGSYRGGSTVALGHAAKLKRHTIYCIDRWAAYLEQSEFANMDSSQLDDMAVLKDFVENTAFVKDQVCMLRGNAADFSHILASNLFGFAFIDGAHDYASVVDDIIFALQVLRPGAILCGHDYHSLGVDVKRAVHDLLMNSETITNKGIIAGTSIWYVVVEDPDYELLIAKTIREMTFRRYEEAYAILAGGMQKMRQTPEIARLLRGLADEIAAVNA